MRIIKIEGDDLVQFQGLFLELQIDTAAWQNSALELGFDSEGVKVRMPGGHWSPGYGTPQPAKR